MYSVTNLLQKEPNAIRGAILSILGVLVMTNVVSISAEAVAGIGVSIELLLTLFYVRPMSVSRKGMEELANGE